MHSFKSPNDLRREIMDNAQEIMAEAELERPRRYRKKTLENRSAELKAMILKNLEGTPGAKLGDIFENEIEKLDWNKVQINFSDNAFRGNMFKEGTPGYHVSFVPILLNYGWDVGKDIGVGYHQKFAKADPSIMTYQYYAGCYFITKAIAEFNEKYKKLNIKAEFFLGDKNITLYDGNGKLPYIR
jgi:hypothetical protein